MGLVKRLTRARGFQLRWLSADRFMTAAGSRSYQTVLVAENLPAELLAF